MSTAFGKFRNTDERAGQRESQIAAEKLSQNIAKKWRMNDTRARMGSVGEGNLPWATPCLGASRFFLNEKRINIFRLMHIALFFKVIY